MGGNDGRLLLRLDDWAPALDVIFEGLRAHQLVSFSGCRVVDVGWQTRGRSTSLHTPRA